MREWKRPLTERSPLGLGPRHQEESMQMLLQQKASGSRSDSRSDSRSEEVSPP